MTDTTEIERIAVALSKAQQRAFLTITKPEWHRRAFRADRTGGRSRDFDRIRKCLRLGLIEHRVNGGAEYRLTPLGLSVRTYLESSS